jgi:hypothetical protein
VYVAPSGNDSNCVRYASNPPATPLACKSFDKAYRLAQCGDLVEMEDGQWSTAQTIGYDASKNSCTPSTRITFRKASGASPRLNGNWNSGQLEFEGVKHLVLDGLIGIGPFGVDPDGSCAGAAAGRRSEDIVIQNSHLKAFRFIYAAKDVTVRNTVIGDYAYEESGAVSNGVDGCDGGGPYSENIVFDHVTWQNITETSSPTHPECLIAEDFDGLTIRNSKFKTCPLGIETIPGTGFTRAWNLTFENNFFTCVSWCTWFWDMRAGADATLKNWTVRFNTILNGSFLFNESGNGSHYTNFKVYGNVFDSEPGCLPGSDVTYAYNVFASPWSPDPNCINTGNTASANVSAMLANPGNNDLHLKTGGPWPADNLVPVSYCAALGCPSTDIDDSTRPAGAALDAGADDR